MLIELAVFTQLAKACAPHVAVETLASVARLESGFDEFALHDNTARRSFRPATREEAIGLATELVTNRRHSVDLGIMQVNSANLSGLKMTIADAFDVCHSLSAADHILIGYYSAPAQGGDDQMALRQALSRYNTGDAARGFANGYVQRVQSSAEIIVPALRLRAEADAAGVPLHLYGTTKAIPDPARGATSAPVTARAPALPPPAIWDVYGQARAARFRSSGGGSAQVNGTFRPGEPSPAQAPLLSSDINLSASSPSATPASVVTTTVASMLNSKSAEPAKRNSLPFPEWVRSTR